ncbi:MULTISPECIES: heavy-metal-associated domain-containing protein [Allobacillus]|uniref:Heavy-metal-associated domain-containing protein n=1 Tax=Allobacillus salarius TaxID=1955272 RepID=A0A556PDK1_9BACI|nr:heavy-metal-associated domain-containing protein [Allobacillus salarius]TSJ62444.1 heavy-metal-associated domain-containing protein [Allobacillus salarius]
MKKILLTIDPLTCPGCASEMESMILEKEGIELGKVFHQLGKVLCRYDEEKIDSDTVEHWIQQIDATVR